MASYSQFFDLFDWIRPHADALSFFMKGEFVREAMVACIRRFGGSLRGVPADLYFSAAGCVVESLRGVVSAVVKSILAFMFGGESFTVEVAHCIFGVARINHPTCVGFVAVHGQLKQFHAFEVTEQVTLVLPVFHVHGGVESAALVFFSVGKIVNQHHPVAAKFCGCLVERRVRSIVCIPNNLWVTSDMERLS